MKAKAKEKENMTTFKEIGIKDQVLRGIEELGFETPMPIQEKVIPVLLENKGDLVGLAQTGTGKTAAFGLPLIQLTDTSKKYPQALILSPTRELCMQIANDIEKYSKYVKGLKVLAVYGGAAIINQIRSLDKGVHIIVATPGRMLDLINRKRVDLSHIAKVVLDEADEMLNMGFKEELDGILEKTPDEKETLLFSATMPREVARISKNYMNNPQEITCGTKNAGSSNVTHVCYMVHARDRYMALKRIADINPSIYGIIFCRTRMDTKEVADKLMEDGYSADALHGDLSQAQRDYVMNRFRKKNIQMLVATDVAARGIDVTDLTHVINYNLPDDVESYTHRSGRTGRAGKKGVSVAIINMKEKSRIRQIEKKLQKEFIQGKIPTGNEICKVQMLNLIDRIKNVEVDNARIEEFIPAIEAKLEGIAVEDLVKKIVSLEFNRFLDYYKDAQDINVVERTDNRSRNTHKAGAFDRFFINIGKIDGLTPQRMIGLIKDQTGNKRIDIGAIDIMNNFSFFEVDMSETNTILSSFDNVKFKKRKISVELSQGKKSSSRRKKRRF